MTRCKGPNCGKSLAGKRPNARYCSPTCRSEAWHQAHPGKDTRNTGKALRSVAKRRRRRTGTRPPTRYLVWRRDAADFLDLIGEATANRAEGAIRLAVAHKHERHAVLIDESECIALPATYFRT